jgi:hypothetical protein
MLDLVQTSTDTDQYHCLKLFLITNTELCYQMFFCLPTDSQENCLKNNFKVYVKIDIKTAATCCGAITPSSGSALLALAKVTVVKIAN